MGDATYTPRDLLNYSFATWIFELHMAGVSPAEGDILSQLKAIADADDEAAADTAGAALVSAVDALLDGDDGADAVLSAAKSLFGDRAGNTLGAGSRDERNQRIRTYQFGSSLPWLARVYQREDDGSVGPHWLVVERVDTNVTAMDPNPWNDVDEEQRVPVADFHVLWELGACTSVSLA